MKKILFTFYCLLAIGLMAEGQTFIAVPNYASTTNSFASSTGNIKFYFGSTSQTLTVGRGANGVCFFGNNMFVAIDDGGSSKGIMWYANVSFATGTFVSDSPVVLTNGQGTFSVAADAAGNIYTANSNGTVTKFIRAASAPFYNSSSVTTATFWNTPSSFASTGGVMIDDATSTIWAVSYANNQAAVCKLSAFGTASSLKKISTDGSYIQNPEGIAKDNLGNIWIGNNNNNYVLRINVAAVNTIITELDAANYTTKTLIEGTNINDFVVSATGHQLGGIVYDNLYSSKLYINDQVSGGNSFIYSFTPTNTTPTFTATTMSQIYPGAGQCAIIPCAILPKPVAAAANISSGQTATLTANNCATGTTYQWKDGATIVGTNASYTTSVLNANKTYTVACVNSAACTGITTSVTVNVSGCTAPANPSAASASPVNVNIGLTSTLTASGCASGTTYLWKNGTTTVGTDASFTTPNLVTNTTYTAYCTNGSCISTGVNVPLSVTNNFVVAANATTRCPQQQYTYTYTGCSNGIVYWSDFGNAFGFTPMGQGQSLAYATADPRGSTIDAQCQIGTTVINSANSLGVLSSSSVDVFITGSTVITTGSSTTLTASGCNAPLTYVWKQGTTTVGTSAIYTTPNLTSNTTYTANCSNSPCPDLGKDVTVEVCPSVIANPSTVTASPANIAAGQSSTLAASGCAAGYTYLWKNGPTVFSSSASFTTPVLNASTTYTVFCKNGSCQSPGANITVNICTAIASPTNVLANPATVRTGQTTTLSSTGCASGSTIQWMLGNTLIGSTLSISSSSMNSTTTYRAKCVNGACESAVVNVTVAVKEATYFANPTGSGVDFFTSPAATLPNHTLAINTPAAAVIFSGNDLLVASGSNLLIYAGISFNPYNGASITPTTISIGSSTSITGITIDGSGNVYVATLNGIVTRLLKSGSGSYTIDKRVRFNSGTAGNRLQGINYSVYDDVLWVNTAINSNGAFEVCKRTDFITNGTTTATAGTAAFIRVILGQAPLSSLPFLDGIVTDGVGDLWLTADNGNVYKLLRSTVTFILSQLNATSNVTYPLNSTKYTIGSVSPNSLGAAIYDGTYDKQIYFVNGSGKYSTFDPNANVNAYEFIGTNYTSYGQGAIIPCNLLAPPANPLVSASLAITAPGQATTLTASGCGTYQTYKWLQGTTTVSLLATYTTPIINSNIIYTAKCVNNTCEGTGTDVALNVTTPCPNSITITAATYPSYTANQVVQAGQYITTTSPPNIVINSSNSNKLTYQAGNSIILSPGFSVQNGAVYKAQIGGCGTTATPTMQVNGRFLYDANNQKMILRGANLPLLDDWSFPGSDKLTELEKTGVNTVRIQWYINYGNPSRPAYTLTDLDNFLTKCKNNFIIPVLELHDFTCGSDVTVLNSQAIPWWISSAVLTILNKHKKYLIINLANELGVYRWAANPTTALLDFKNAYKTAITSIRNAGLDMPIMIDAPDCGTTISAFNSIGVELVNHDPKHNLLLSSHTYWAGYDGTSEIAAAITNNLPIVFGEVANKQFDNGDECYYDIDGTSVNHVPPTGFAYQNLLNTCQTNELGWIVWSWYPDNCSARRMSSDGNYVNLTIFGNDITNNATYGTKTKAVRSTAF